ncbi:hypothetical protein B0H13DRAFT_1869579 [Mycena leptocephala]|nr:hypothetical protein B0H13DRAFT_1869579 [Mycena leptocephala]
MKYVEDKNGQPVDGYRRTSIGKVAAQIWFELVKKDIAPRTRGQASLEIATANYPSWYKTHGKADGEKTSRTTKASATRQRRAESPPSEIRKKIKLDDGNVIMGSQSAIGATRNSHFCGDHPRRCYVVCFD